MLTVVNDLTKVNTIGDGFRFFRQRENE